MRLLSLASGAAALSGSDAGGGAAAAAAAAATCEQRTGATRWTWRAPGARPRTHPRLAGSATHALRAAAAPRIAPSESAR
jgi:hypothetical protein